MNQDLVKLFNRISFYLCNKSNRDNIEITDNMTVKELKEILDKFYSLKK